MRSVVAFPGTMDHARQMALALHEQGMLDAFVTAFAFLPGGRLDSAVARLPAKLSKRVSLQLSRRAIPEIPRDKVELLPLWDLARICANQLTDSPRVADWLWQRRSLAFDRTVAKRWVPLTKAILGFEFTALHSFRAAKDRGVARVLDLPSLDSREFEAILRRERDMHPELRTSSDHYFDTRFDSRYAHRLQEIELADIIIANSSLTARSHIAAGANPDDVYVVPLGGIAPLREIRRPPLDRSRPLRVIWAGAFSIRKGAHYLVEAWSMVVKNGAALLDVYGSNLLPSGVTKAAESTISFHGRIPQSVLFQKFQEADVLVFPTLSDGFGAVITEAMAHGLPVITTEQAGAADLLTPESSIIIPAGDSRALAAALTWCLDNRVALEEMREKALQVAAGRQWSDYRSDLVRALDKGLARKGYPVSYLRPAPRGLPGH